MMMVDCQGLIENKSFNHLPDGRVVVKISGRGRKPFVSVPPGSISTLMLRFVSCRAEDGFRQRDERAETFLPPNTKRAAPRSQVACEE
jgi:hypothetical protein